MQSPFTFYPDCDNNLNLLTDCDKLCHVIHILHLDRIRQDKYSVPPYFQQHVKDTSCRFGHVARLECDVTGIPQPEVEWFKDEQDECIVEEIGKYDVISEDGHVALVVYDVGPNDIGSYTCKIFNALGESRSIGRIFFTPNILPHPYTTKESTKLVIQETLRIVEHRTNDCDVTTKQMTSSSLSDEGKESVTLRFAMPECSRVRDMSVETETLSLHTKSKDNKDDNLTTRSLSVTPVTESAENYSIDPSTSISSYDPMSAIPTSPMSTTESVFEEQIGGLSSSDSSDDDIIERVRWIERGESSNSDFRRGSIPYPMSLLPLRSQSLDSGSYSSPQSSEEVLSNLSSSIDYKSQNNRDRVEEKMLKLTGLQMSPSLPSTRSFSSGSQSSAVGSGMIVRVVRALSQNEYFDSFFEKDGEETDEETYGDENSICKLLALQPTLRESAKEEEEQQNRCSVHQSKDASCPRSKQPSPEIMDKNLTETQDGYNVSKTENVQSPVKEEKAIEIEQTCEPTDENSKNEMETLEGSENLRGFRAMCKSFDEPSNYENDLDKTEENLVFFPKMRQVSCSSETDAIPTLKKLCRNVIMKCSDKKSLSFVQEDSRNMNELIRNLLEFSDKQHGFGSKSPLSGNSTSWADDFSNHVTCQNAETQVEEIPPMESMEIYDNWNETREGGLDSDHEPLKIIPKKTENNGGNASRTSQQPAPSFPYSNDQDMDSRRGSIISFSSVASTTYYSAEDDDGMLSETTLEYYSPNEGDFLSTDDFFSPDSEIQIPSSNSNLLPSYLLNRHSLSTQLNSNDVDDMQLFVPRPSPRPGNDETSQDEISSCRIIAFNNTISDDLTEATDSGEETPVVNEFSDDENLIALPTFKEQLADLSTSIGNTVRLLCLVEGNPPPTVLWYKDCLKIPNTKQGDDTEMGKRIDITASNENMESTVRHTLCIKNVIAKDSGNYSASATNRFGDVTSSCKVHVQQDPKCLKEEVAHVTRFVVSKVESDCDIVRPKSDQNSSHVVKPEIDSNSTESQITSFSMDSVAAQPKVDLAPYFEDIMEDIEAKSGKDVTLSVRIYGEPPPIITWYKDDREIDDGNCVRINDNECHSLLIKNVTSDQSGIYSCRGNNRVGEVICKAELSVVRCGDWMCSSDDERSYSSIARRHLKDDYIINDVIWSGSFSHVKSVTSRLTYKTFAARFIKGRGVGSAMFENEVKILGSFQHKNIVAYCDHYKENKYRVIVTEKCEKELFNHFLEVNEITEMRIAFYISQLCDALIYMHDRSIVHLKLKPENLLLLDDLSTLKVVDFSSAKELLPNQPVYWNRGIPDFVAPEIVMSEPVTTTTDMWSVGVMTYVAISGISPFAGDTDQATVLRIRDNDWSFNHKEFAIISSEAKSFVESLLGWTPSGRISATEARRHAWLSTQSCVPLATEKLKYFQSRRTWQRSLVSPKSSTVIRSIPSLLQGEFDSTSLTVPRHANDDVTSSTSNTDSEDELYGVSFIPSKDSNPSVRIQAASPVQSAAVARRQMFSESRSFSGSMERPLQLNNVPAAPQTNLALPGESKDVTKKKLSSIGKKVSFEDEVYTSQHCTPSDEEVFLSESPTLCPLDNATESRPKYLDLNQANAGIKETPNGNTSNSVTSPPLRKTSRGSLKDEKNTSPTAGCCVHPGIWTRPPPHPSPTHPSSPKPHTRKPTKSILKKSGSIDGESGSKTKISDDKFPIDLPFKRKPFIKSPSLDVSGRMNSATDSPTSFRKISAAARRRLNLRRGESAESALKPSKTRSGGLRGPLLEQRGAISPDTDTVGARMRGSPGIKKVNSSEVIHKVGRQITKSTGDSPTLSQPCLPRVRTQLKDCDVIEGCSLMLRCAFDTTLPYGVTWRKDRVDVKKSSKHVITNDVRTGECSLTIPRPSIPEVEGEYSCVVTNKHGTTISNCQVTKAVVPDPPTSPEVIRVQGNDVWLTWQAPTNCCLTDIRYVLEYKDTTDEWKLRDDSIRTTAYHVIGLQPSATYQFRVAATTKKGTGSFSLPSTYTVIP